MGAEAVQDLLKVLKLKFHVYVKKFLKQLLVEKSV